VCVCGRARECVFGRVRVRAWLCIVDVCLRFQFVQPFKPLPLRPNKLQLRLPNTASLRFHKDSNARKEAWLAIERRSDARGEAVVRLSVPVVQLSVPLVAPPAHGPRGTPMYARCHRKRQKPSAVWHSRRCRRTPSHECVPRSHAVRHTAVSTSSALQAKPSAVRMRARASKSPCGLLESFAARYATQLVSHAAWYPIRHGIPCREASPAREMTSRRPGAVAWQSGVLGRAGGRAGVYVCVRLAGGGGGGFALWVQRMPRMSRVRRGRTPCPLRRASPS
jgi:hypothetical protein